MVDGYSALLAPSPAAADVPFSVCLVVYPMKEAIHMT